MRIVCWQTILMKYHSLLFSKIKKDVAKFASAAVVIGSLRVNSFCIMVTILQLQTLFLFLFCIMAEIHKMLVCLFDLILYVPSTIFQLNRDGSSWVEPVLS